MSIHSLRSRFATLTLSLSALLFVGALSHCQKPSFDSEGSSSANARRIATRGELIGGSGALGEVGDYLLENDQIRVIIQDKGYSRGFGVYGGGLTDADRVRPLEEAGVLTVNGRDQFGELFPIFFLQAMKPTEVSVISDGAAESTAAINVRGHAGNFLTMAKTINQVVMNSNDPPWDPETILLQKLQYLQDPENLNGDPQLQYDVTYSLEPGKSYVEITTRITNITEEEISIPSDVAAALLAIFVPEMGRLDVPMGFVILYGAGNKAFSPGFGYNIRFSLEDRYETVMPFPALSGLVTDGIISTSPNGISYGFFGSTDVQGKAQNFAKNRFDEDGVNLYEKNFGDKVGDESLLLPFLASSFTGVFYAQAPPALGANDYIEFKNYFVVGTGDVGSVMDTIYEQRAVKTNLVRGRVRDTFSLLPVHKASVVIYDAGGRPMNQAFTDEKGNFKVQLPSGDYSARVEKDPVLSEPVPFSVNNQAVHLELSKPGAATLSVQVRDSIGRPLPAKITVTSGYNAEEVQAVRDGLRTWEFLFDLGAGQHWRISDQIVDDPDDPSTMRFIEAVGFTEDGHAQLELPTGRAYKVFVSRGTEYNIQTFDIPAGDLKPGAGVSLAASLKRVVDTTGYIAADYHIHAAPSLDSDVGLHLRVVTGAAEGLECLVATDHNVITDYAPAIEKAGLTEWTGSMVGLELTTLEAGHFNGFPLRREKSEITKGSFEWSDRPPRELFDDVRSLGAISPEKTLIQINHARDSILGYFAQFDVDALSGARADLESCEGLACLTGSILSANGPAFFNSDGSSALTLDDQDFNVIEVINGPILFQSFHARMPEDIEGAELEPDIVDQLPEPGTILCDGGKVAFPGVVDDWFNLLNLGKTFTGVANSDSHSENNLGYPRTYVYMGTDDPSLLDQETMVDALMAQRATMSNGPFLEFWINGEPIGSRIEDADGSVDLKLRVQAPDWVEVNQLTIIVNGLDKVVEPVEMENGSYTWEGELQLNRDSWLVAMVRGDKSMFPVVQPKDVPPFQLSDAFSTLAGPLGFGSSTLSSIAPKRTGIPRPLGLSNPIWVSVDGTPGFDPPGMQPRVCEDFGLVFKEPGTEASGLRHVPPRAPLRGSIRNSFGFPRIHGDIHDIRSIFEAHIGHAHSH